MAGVRGSGTLSVFFFFLPEPKIHISHTRRLTDSKSYLLFRNALFEQNFIERIGVRIMVNDDFIAVNSDYKRGKRQTFPLVRNGDYRVELLLWVLYIVEFRIDALCIGVIGYLM